MSTDPAVDFGTPGLLHAWFRHAPIVSTSEINASLATGLRVEERREAATTAEE